MCVNSVVLLKASWFQYRFRTHLQPGKTVKNDNTDMQDSLVQVRVATANVADVAFEMLNVDGIEADDRGVQANVGLGQLVAEVERTS